MMVEPPCSPLNRTVGDVSGEAKVISDVVRSNIGSIGLKDLVTVSGIIVEGLARHNKYSSRLGASVTIQYVTGGKTAEKCLWMKRVESPKAAFFAILSVYEKLSDPNVSNCMPQPYFFDEDTNLIFIEKIGGTSFRKLTLDYVMISNVFASQRVPLEFFRIGQWLQSYQNAISTRRFQTLKVTVGEIRDSVLYDAHFSTDEIPTILSFLDKLEGDKLFSKPFPIVKPHNDFTLRNIFIQNDNCIKVIDWDAMVHPEFPREAPCWWDLTALFLNTQSLLKIHPFVRKDRIKKSCSALIDGYFLNNKDICGIGKGDFVDKILYLFALGYYIGYQTDRPLYKIYSRNMGWRYATMLRRQLLRGGADVT